MAEARLGQRRIGQSSLVEALLPAGAGSHRRLERIAGQIDWAPMERLLAPLRAPTCRPGDPPLALFRALLLATRHYPPTVRLTVALEDRSSFRRFCSFAANEPTPERTTFVRFRRELVRRGLDRALFEAVTPQLEANGVLVRTGTLVDATLIPSASIRRDREARWAGHRRRKPTHGYKAHVATHEGAGLIRGGEVTTANVHDAAELAAVLPEQPGRVYADSAVAGRKAEAVIRTRGGVPWTIGTGTWGGAEALARLEAHNAAVQRVRCRIEKVFGTCKRSYGLRRMRWLGLATAGLQVRLAAVAYNLRRTLTLLHAAAD